MPKSRKMSMAKNGQGKSVSPNAIQRIAGAQLYNSSNASVTTVPISPASFTRALAIADLFQFYRFVKVVVKQMPVTIDTSLGTTKYVIHAFAPGSEFDTPPTTPAQLIELPRYIYHGLGKGVDTVLNLGRKDLLAHAQLPWFKTIAGTEDPQFEIQGNLYNLNNVGTAISYIIEYEVEFQSPNLAAQSPFRKSPSQTYHLVPDTAAPVDNQGTVIINGQKFVKMLA